MNYAFFLIKKIDLHLGEMHSYGALQIRVLCWWGSHTFSSSCDPRTSSSRTDFSCTNDQLVTQKYDIMGPLAKLFATFYKIRHEVYKFITFDRVYCCTSTRIAICQSSINAQLPHLLRLNALASNINS